MSDHLPDCDVNDTNPDGIKKPCNCGISSLPASAGSAFLRTITEGLATKPCFETLADCYQQGQAASGQAYRRNQNPYPQGTDRREWWDGGWCNEGDELCGER